MFTKKMRSLMTGCLVFQRHVICTFHLFIPTLKRSVQPVRALQQGILQSRNLYHLQDLATAQATLSLVKIILKSHR
jgi:hypothetical protein